MRIFSFLEFVLFDLEFGGMFDYEMTVFEIAMCRWWMNIGWRVECSSIQR
jgi:hypothetical protein